MGITAPALLTSQHDVSAFTSDEPTLDIWLKERALKNQMAGASRTYVVCNDNYVIAYYCLSSGIVTTNEATGAIKRNMPREIPMILLGRLAVDTRYTGKGIGRALVNDALQRALQAADIIGVRGVLVDALSPTAKVFWESVGFQASGLDPMKLMVRISDLATILKPR
ncbi:MULTISPECIES: GNAT family N-acetyltransferase [Aeromonas]|jgi:GNAT superfamily N-acetyltransferase|uniref:GNAT family N-acetyltransferase n=1 Tax=Aeromonas TaxID=642 RepID=UPI0005A78511|nr:GNAT family N-acetyltransferase [Aeromonas fluvialis]EKP0260249.1 GNAT family N-acetyltransferase [Aeromonas sobria]